MLFSQLTTYSRVMLHSHQFTLNTCPSKNIMHYLTHRVIKLMQVWWSGFKWSKKGFPPRKRPSVSSNERPPLLSRALWQPMREPGWVRWFPEFFDSFESAPKVFKQPSSTGTGHLSLDSRGERSGALLSLSLFCIMCIKYWQNTL